MKKFKLFLAKSIYYTFKWVGIACLVALGLSIVYCSVKAVMDNAPLFILGIFALIAMIGIFLVLGWAQETVEEHNAKK